jgi:hypothetical protein
MGVGIEGEKRSRPPLKPFVAINLRLVSRFKSQDIRICCCLASGSIYIYMLEGIVRLPREFAKGRELRNCRNIYIYIYI